MNALEIPLAVRCRPAGGPTPVRHRPPADAQVVCRLLRGPLGHVLVADSAAEAMPEVEDAGALSFGTVPYRSHDAQQQAAGGP